MGKTLISNRVVIFGGNLSEINPEICKTCKNYNKPADCEKARTVTNTCPQLKKQTVVKSKKITRKKAKSAPKKKK